MNLKLIQELEQEYGSMRNVPEDEPKLIELRKSTKKILGLSNNSNESLLGRMELAEFRKKEVLNLNSKGHGSFEIAKKLDLSERTVRNMIFKSGQKVTRKFQFIFKTEGKPDLYFQYKSDFDIYVNKDFLSEHTYAIGRIKDNVYKADLPDGVLFIENKKLMKKGEVNEEIERYYTTKS